MPMPFGDGAEVLVDPSGFFDDIGQRLGNTGTFSMDIFEPGPLMSKKKAIFTVKSPADFKPFSPVFFSH